jgi:hypothetical protein
MRPPSGTRHHFIEFAHRDGLPREHAAFEYDNHLTANGQAMLKDWYLHTSRVGAPFTLNRAQRLSLYLTFENAQAHAWFAAEA